jgi:isopentenyldiphosphate isomerase
MVSVWPRASARGWYPFTVEMIDVLDAGGSPTGRTKPKPHIHRDGDLHRSVHVWIIASDDRILVQRRAAVKENNPGSWDVSCAGHISAGESAIDAAIREAEEELGMALEPDELQHVATLRERSVLNGGTYIDNEIHEIFIVRRDVDVSALRLQEEEVGDVRLVTWKEFALLERVAHEEEYALVGGMRKTKC